MHGLKHALAGAAAGALLFGILMESVSPAVAAAGAVAGALSALAIRPLAPGGAPVRGCWRLRYFCSLLGSMAVSTLRLLALALRPGPLPAGVLHLAARAGERGRVLVANSITLTPGTVTLEEDAAGYTVLCAAPPDPERQAEIAGAFERRLGKEEKP